MADLTFYTNPFSRGRIVRWMLEEVGAPYETVFLGYGEPMKSPEFLAINPMGKVPTVRHGETVVTEAAAICAYLADAFPDAGLAPPTAERGAYYRWLFFGAGPVEAAVTARGLKLEPSADQGRQAGFGSVELTMETLAGALSERPYIAGDTFSAADVYLASQVSWIKMFELMDFSRAPGVSEYLARATDRDAYRRANEIDDAAAADFAPPPV